MYVYLYVINIEFTIYTAKLYSVFMKSYQSFFLVKGWYSSEKKYYSEVAS